jgi:hypothetical protein
MMYIPDSKGAYIPCLYFKNEKAVDGKLVLFFHGIWEDIGVQRLHQLMKEMATVWQAHVLLVEYPGYG